MTTEDTIRDLPKAELHYHIDCISPELCWKFSQRNRIEMPFSSLDECRSFYRYNDLEGFIRVVLTAVTAIRTAEDILDLVVDCAEDMMRQNITYREAMFDYMACFAPRDIALETVISGFERGLEVVREQYPELTIVFIANIDRTKSPSDNLRFLEELSQYRSRIPIVAIGLDSQESGFPAYLQEPVFVRAKELGFYLTAHAGEDAGPASIWDTLCSLHVDRIDHGVRAVEDEELMDYLAKHQIPLTLCPASNISLSVCPDWESFPIQKFLDRGVQVCINSDDPPYFGYDLVGNLMQLVEVGVVTEDMIPTLIKNSFENRFHKP